MQRGAVCKERQHAERGSVQRGAVCREGHYAERDTVQREVVCREGQCEERGSVQKGAVCRERQCRHVGTSKGVAKAWPGRAGERGPCSEKPALFWDGVLDGHTDLFSIGVSVIHSKKLSTSDN